MKQVKRLLIKFLICAALVLVIDRLLGMLMMNALKNARHGELYAYNYMLFNARPGVAVIGSSRAHHHYNPAIMQSGLGVKAINYGVDGSGILFYYIVLKTLLLQYKPQLVVVDINQNEFDKPLKMDKINSLYPLYNKMHLDDSDIYKISPYEKYKLLFYTYRFNNRFYETMSAANGPAEDIANINGYAPLAPEQTKLPLLTTSTWHADKPAYECLRNIITLCKSKGVPLIICISPFYYNLPHNATATAVEALCKEYKAPCLNYLNNNYLTLSANMYSDLEHLTATGADIFTRDFDERVKGLIPSLFKK